MILTYFESIFRTEFSQGYQVFEFFNWISDYHEDQFQKSSAGTEILEKKILAVTVKLVFKIMKTFKM